MESNIPSRISYQPIGIIHTSFSNIEGMPIQPAGAANIRGTVEIFEEYPSARGFFHQGTKPPQPDRVVCDQITEN